jgi:ankyrin repeat protein
VAVEEVGLAKWRHPPANKPKVSNRRGKQRGWLLGAAGALALTLLTVGGWLFYRAQLNNGLIAAVAANNLAGARALLDRGADPNARHQRSFGAPVLVVAVSRSGPEMLKLLLDRGAKVDATAEGGDTALIEAASKSDVAVLKVLLDHGAAVNAVDSQGLTPLLAAAWRCRTENLRFLLRHGADPNATCVLGNATKMAQRGMQLRTQRAQCSETLTVLAAPANATPQK